MNTQQNSETCFGTPSETSRSTASKAPRSTASAPPKTAASSGIDTLLSSRGLFLRTALKCFGLAAFSFSLSSCRQGPLPPLRGISPRDYDNIHSIGEIFLKGNPIKNFDIGAALDNYIYGHPSPLPTRADIHELAALPSSRLASLSLDLSFTPLSQLDPKAREERLLSWQRSNSKLKRGLYNLLCALCFFLLGSNHDFLVYTGYLNGK